MFHPHYQITAKLLSNVKRIATLIVELNKRQFTKVVLMEMERTAREISAHASTSIEGNPLPLTEVKKILKSKPLVIRNSEKEVLNYNETLLWLNLITKKNQTVFSLPTLLRIQKMVMKDLLPSFRCGRLREESVFVNDPQLRKTVYWPPDQQDVPSLIQDLFQRIKKNESLIDPLLLAGIFHKQLVIIHPFMDGNGRTVRLATKILLAKMGLDTFNLFSFENFYNNNVAQYFQFVGERGNYYDLKDSIDFTSWLEYFTDGIIDELLRVKKILETKVITPKMVLGKHHEMLLQYVKEQGFITDKIYSTLTKRAKPTRHLDFKKLIKLGLIEQVGKGKATIYRPREF
jgi:Fic family protein